jgi:hypothetical protein
VVPVTGPVVPPGGEELREAMAEALYGLMGYTRPWSELEDWRQEKWRGDTDVLLPSALAFADQRAAEVLRAAAAEQRAEAETVPDTDQGTHADGHRCAATFLDRRAAAVAPEDRGRHSQG